MPTLVPSSATLSSSAIECLFQHKEGGSFCLGHKLLPSMTSTQAILWAIHTRKHTMRWMEWSFHPMELEWFYGVCHLPKFWMCKMQRSLPLIPVHFAFTIVPSPLMVPALSVSAILRSPSLTLLCCPLITLKTILFRPSHPRRLVSNSCSDSITIHFDSLMQR